jgi:hypothetical protein
MVVAALLAGCERHTAAPPKPTPPEDPRPFTPWHAAATPMPFQGDWYWQDLLAIAPAPEPLPSDSAATERSKAAFERIATLNDLQSDDELPALVADARLDPAPLFAALDDSRREVRYAAARVMLRLMVAKGTTEGCPFPQRLVDAAGHHLRDTADEVAVLHLETIARSGFAWTAPVLLKTFGKVDNHRLTVLRIRAAAKLALDRCYGGMNVLIKVLKENTSIQDDVNREWDASPQTAWWKEEAILAIAHAAGTDFGHSPDASDAEQVACIRRIEDWWRENHVRLWSEAPPLDDPLLIERVKLLILAFGTFQIRNVDNSGFILAGLGPKVAPWLFEALRGSSFMIRRHVLGVITTLVKEVPESERPKWIDAVIPSLSDRDPAIRVRALEVIGAARIPQSLPYLEKALAPADIALCETALRQLALQGSPAARSVLERFASQVPSGHALAVPLAAARLAAGDLAPLPDYMKRLDGERGPDPRAQLYLSWILESDGLADAKSAADRKRAVERIAEQIKTRAAAIERSSQ